MKNNLYMAMPVFMDQPVTGVFREGEAVPADPDNEHWVEYLAFCESGGKALIFDASMEWRDGAWRINGAKARELFEARQRDAVTQINAYIVEQRAIAAGTSDPGELQARVAKRAVAEAVVAGNASEAQQLNLATEAQLRGMGETAEALAAKIIDKAVALDGVNARLDGLKRAAENALLATTKQEELDACIERFRLQIAAVATDGGEAA
jgi:hypothetical protein